MDLLAKVTMVLVFLRCEGGELQYLLCLPMR